MARGRVTSLESSGSIRKCKLANSAASAIANAATRSALDGSNFGDNVVAAIPDVIGAAIGNAAAGGLGAALGGAVNASVTRNAVDNTQVASGAATVGEEAAQAISGGYSSSTGGYVNGDEVIATGVRYSSVSNAIANSLTDLSLRVGNSQSNRAFASANNAYQRSASRLDASNLALSRANYQLELAAYKASGDRTYSVMRADAVRARREPAEANSAPITQLGDGDTTYAALTTDEILFGTIKHIATLDNIQTGLDGVGFVPVVGMGADLLNAGISLLRGNFGEAGVNAIAIIPVAGDAFKAGKLSGKHADKIDDGWEVIPVSKIREELKDGFEGIYKFADDLVTDGAQYVGQSQDVAGRVLSHVKNPLKAITEDGMVFVKHVAGGKEAREVAEFREIRRITDNTPAKRSYAVTNRVDPIGLNRSYLLNKYPE